MSTLQSTRSREKGKEERGPVYNTFDYWSICQDWDVQSRKRIMTVIELSYTVL